MTPTESSNTGQHRRRGAALEAALLEATWQELLETGYDALTYDAVAVRAATSRAVLYRRWPAKPELARAAVEHGLVLDRVTIPDTGSIRHDVVELLERLNETRIRAGVAVMGRLGPYFHDVGVTIGDMRDLLTGDRGSSMDVILARAKERGELAAGPIAPRVAQLPLDLFRHEVLITMQRVPSETIASIVDDVFLPLLHAVDSPTRGSRDRDAGRSSASS